MGNTKHLGVTHVSLTTAAAAVTAAPSMATTSKSMVLGCRSGGVFVEWQRQQLSDSALSVTCLDSKESIELEARPGETKFYAFVNSGTGTLEIEWLG